MTAAPWPGPVSRSQAQVCLRSAQCSRRLQAEPATPQTLPRLPPRDSLVPGRTKVRDRVTFSCLTCGWLPFLLHAVRQRINLISTSDIHWERKQASGLSHSLLLPVTCTQMSRLSAQVAGALQGALWPACISPWTPPQLAPLPWAGALWGGGAHHSDIWAVAAPERSC